MKMPKLAAIKPTAPAPAPRSNPPAKITEPGHLWKTEWTYWAVGAAVAALVLACVCVELMTTRPEIVQARSSQESPEKTVANIAPVQTAPVKTTSVQKPTPLPVSGSASNVTKISAAPRPTGFADLKLQGIFFSAKHPSAIINGQRVEPRDHLGDVLVMDITSRTVTLEYKQQIKTLVLE